MPTLPWRRRRRGPVLAVDLGSSRVKLVLAKPERGVMTVIQTASHALPQQAISDGQVRQPQLVAGVLQQMVADVPQQNLRVVTAITGSGVVNRQLKLPVMPVRELASAVGFEAEKFLPSQGQEMILDFINYGEKMSPEGKYLDVLLVAASRRLVNGYLAVFQQVQLTLSAIEIPALALARLLTEISGSKPAALVDLGAEATTLIVASQGRILFSRVLKTGGLAITGAVEQELDMEWEQAELFKISKGQAAFGELYLDDPASGGGLGLATPVTGALGPLIDEVRRSLDFFRAQYKDVNLERLYTCGGTSQLRGLAEVLGDEIGLAVEPAQLADWSGAGQLTPDYALALGLALREGSS